MTPGSTALTDPRPVQAEMPERRGLSGAGIGFVAFMLALAVVFVFLGIWQMHRLAWKETLIAHVEQRAASAPVDLPPADQWTGLDAQNWDFQPVRLQGHFNQTGTVLVFTSLSDPRGQYGGPGFWVVTPFVRSGGGTVFVNRGFVPEAQKQAFANGKNLPEGEIEITGIARASEPANPFTPPPEADNSIDYVRNIDRLTALAGDVPEPIAPLYVDQSAGAPGTLPQGGETRMEFPNRHLEYALTWFSLAALVPIMLIVWFFRNRMIKNPRPDVL